MHQRFFMSQPEWSEETKQLVQATVGKGLSKEALLHLQHVSLSKGLDPLANEIYAIPKGNRTTLIVAIGGMLKLCSPQLDGVETVWFDKEGQAQSVWIQEGSPKGCQVTVWRKGCTKPFTAAVRYSDFAAGGMWAKMGSVMIRKVALAHALRTGFADLLSGLYAQEEMDQAGFDRPAIQMQQDVDAGKPGTTDQAPSVEQATAAVAKAFDGQAVDSTPASLKSGGSATVADSESLKNGTGDSQTAVARSDSAQPSVIDQLRQPAATNPGADPLPNRDDLPGAIGALYRKAQQVGLTRQGWHTMVQILGGDPIDPSKAMAAVKGLADDAKVKALNAGRNPQHAASSV